MNSIRTSDPGLPGTLRFIRHERGLTQKQFGERCKDPLTQAQVAGFERGRQWCTPDLALRIGKALDPRLAARDPHEARLLAYRVWLKNVEAYGDPALLAEAAAYVEARSAMLPGPLYAQPHARAARAEALARSAKPHGEARSA